MLNETREECSAVIKHVSVSDKVGRSLAIQKHGENRCSFDLNSSPRTVHVVGNRFQLKLGLRDLALVNGDIADLGLESVIINTNRMISRRDAIGMVSITVGNPVDKNVGLFGIYPHSELACL